MNYRFGVRVGVEFVTAFIEICANFLVVVYLTVEDDPFRPVLVMHRLLAAREIDYCQPAHGHADIAINVESVLIRSAVNNGAVHPLENFSIDRSARGVYVSGYPAHRK